MPTFHPWSLSWRSRLMHANLARWVSAPEIVLLFVLIFMTNAEGWFAIVLAQRPTRVSETS